MTNSYSMTYSGRIIALVMAVSYFAGWDLDEGYITEVVMAVLWLVGEGVTLYGRWRAGGISWLGFKK